MNPKVLTLANALAAFSRAINAVPPDFHMVSVDEAPQLPHSRPVEVQRPRPYLTRNQRRLLKKAAAKKARKGK